MMPSSFRSRRRIKFPTEKKERKKKKQLFLRIFWENLLHPHPHTLPCEWRRTERRRSNKNTNNKSERKRFSGRKDSRQSREPNRNGKRMPEWERAA
ncbi:hypothetical protein CDAR_76831 [Caerostris darwini]|uniref:Uncharacterized protein n=1 Tax=Caerostris darwini TaxID=1538125 RepID=A0AAV4QD35_9ARAC|nr:hypothetical protein CDAR_76831 [Caerostris darwini]